MEVHHNFNNAIGGHSGWWEKNISLSQIQGSPPWRSNWFQTDQDQPIPIEIQSSQQSQNEVDQGQEGSPSEQTKTQDNSTHYYSHSEIDTEEYYRNRHGTKVIHTEIHSTSTWSSPASSPVPSSPVASPAPAIKSKVENEGSLTLREILLEKALNVENLGIGEHQKINLEPTDHLHLPKVKTLTWHALMPAESRDEENREKDKSLKLEEFKKKRQMAYKILLSCPNLKLIKDFKFDTDWDIVLASKKINCVRHLYLFDTVNVDHLLDFIEGKPKLEILQLIDTPKMNDPFNPNLTPNGEAEARRKRLTLAIEKLLIATHDTLRVLDLSQFCSRTPTLQIPRMLRLLQLTLGSVKGDPPYSWKPDPSPVLPSHLRVTKMPNLGVLDLSRLQTEENSSWDLYFPTAGQIHIDGNFSEVKVLVLNDQCTPLWMDRVKSGLCPNFKKLIVHSGGGCSSLHFMLVKIFRFWRHLEHLELRICDWPSSSTAFCLDSAFTGLVMETCRRLRVFGPAEVDEDILMSMALTGRNSHVQKAKGPRPSIANLKDLKTLNIILGHKCLGKLARYEEDKDNPMPLLSFVSGRYGFHHLGQLIVTITFDQECPWGKAILKTKFNFLAPYVTLKHKHDDDCQQVNVEDMEHVE